MSNVALLLMLPASKICRAEWPSRQLGWHRVLSHTSIPRSSNKAAITHTGHGGVGGAVAALIAQRPGDDAGVVLVALAHADAAVYDGIQPAEALGIACQDYP